MKLCRWGKNGYEKPGMIDSQGMLRDLSGVLANIDQDTISPKGLARLRKIRPESLPLIKTEPRFGVPYTGITKFVAIGLNYSDHAAEAGLPVPSEPVVFMKATTSISGPNDDIVQPRGSTKLDWEVELGVVIGKRGTNIREADAMKYVYGYTVINDVSAREVQRRHGQQWFKGKSLDGHCPMGPWILTADQVKDWWDLRLVSRVNGEIKQDSNTRHMYFKLPRIIAELSAGLTLEPGDIIATGTPAGVGHSRTPPEFLKAGDVLETEIVGIGLLRNPVG